MADEGSLFEGSVWHCPGEDCDGYVTGEMGMEMGKAIDAHLSEYHNTTLQEFAATGEV